MQNWKGFLGIRTVFSAEFQTRYLPPRIYCMGWGWGQHLGIFTGNEEASSTSIVLKASERTKLCLRALDQELQKASFIYFFNLLFFIVLSISLLSLHWNQNMWRSEIGSDMAKASELICSHLSRGPFSSQLPVQVRWGRGGVPMTPQEWNELRRLWPSLDLHARSELSVYLFVFAQIMQPL